MISLTCRNDYNNIIVKVVAVTNENSLNEIQSDSLFDEGRVIHPSVVPSVYTTL